MLVQSQKIYYVLLLMLATVYLVGRKNCHINRERKFNNQKKRAEIPNEILHLAIAVAVAIRGCDEADIKGDAEIFGGLRHDSAGGELVNLDAHIEASRIYCAVLDQEP